MPEERVEPLIDSEWEWEMCPDEFCCLTAGHDDAHWPGPPDKESDDT